MQVRLPIMMAAYVAFAVSASATAQSIQFTDQTDALFPGGAVAYQTPLPRTSFMGIGMVGGAAVGDFDNDGYQDIFVASDGGRADTLFIYDPLQGTFNDVSDLWFGLQNPAHIGVSVAVADFNNDGFLDVYVTSFGPKQELGPGQHRLYKNQGGQSFLNVAVLAGVDTTALATDDCWTGATTSFDGWGATFGDYDLDGDLDLFVSGWYLRNPPNIHLNCGNAFFRNEGDGTFLRLDLDSVFGTDALTGGVQLFAPRFADMNGDKYPELLLAGDFGSTRYFVNRFLHTGQDSFVDKTVELMNYASGAHGMGQTLADFDNDGLFDWYLTSIFCDPGPGGCNYTDGEGNRLFRNGGVDQNCDDLAFDHLFFGGVADGGWGWGAIAIDADHDGWVDIIETNGNTNKEFCGESSYVFRNELGDGGTGFSREKLGDGFGSIEPAGQIQGRGLISFDYDKDGDQDILIVYNNNGASADCALTTPATVHVYRNETMENGGDVNWLRVKVNTCGHSKLAPNGFGTRVIATVGGNTYYRSIDGGCNYLSQSELTAHFGIGVGALIDELRVEWPMPVACGVPPILKYTTLTNVAVNQTITVPALGDMNCDGFVNSFDIDPFLDALFDPGLYDATYPNCIILNGDINGSGTVDSFDLEPFLDCVVAGGCDCP